MSDAKTKVGSGGRIVIPARYRKAIGIEVGDEVVLMLDGEGLRLVTPRQAVKQAQDLVRKYVPAKTSLADELVAERKKEAERE
jgi:AbrB family looped-hinge helix DNA binding protein